MAPTSGVVVRARHQPKKSSAVSAGDHRYP